MNKAINQITSAIKGAAHGKVTSADLSSGKFSCGKVPFTVYLRPKSEDNENKDIVADCIMEAETTSSPMPLFVSDFSPYSLLELTVTAQMLEDYDIYWIAGNQVGEE